jgi:ferredoxin-NADP reductase
LSVPRSRDRARALDEVIYREELARLAAYGEADIRLTQTREQWEGWSGYRRRIDRELVADVAWPPQERALVFGPTGFVQTAAISSSSGTTRIRTERLGPTG